MQAFLTPKNITHKVNGIELNFYPISISTAFNLKKVAKPLASAFAVLFSDTSGDRGHTQMNSKEEGIEQIVVNSVTVEMANLRAAQKEKAILNFIEAFTEKPSTDVIIRVIMDSLRDEFTQKQEQADVDDFREKLDTDTTMQLLHGVAKANKGVFGPFVGRIEALIQSATATVSQEGESPLVENETSSKTKSSGSESVNQSTPSLTEDIPTNES